MSPMSPRLLRPRATGFNPKSIANLVGWWDMSDALSLFQNSDGTTAASSAGDPVGYVMDKSGSARHATQSTGNNRPIISTTTLNGKRGLTFDNSNDVLNLGNISAPFSSALAGTVFVVFGIPSIDNIYTIFKTRSNNPVTHENSSGLLRSYEGAWRLSRLNAVPIVGMPYSTAQGAPPSAIYTLRASTTDYQIHVSGALRVQTSANWHIGNDYQIGADSSGGSYFNGSIYEVVLYAGFLTDVQRQSVEQYLSRKYSVALV